MGNMPMLPQESGQFSQLVRKKCKLGGTDIRWTLEDGVGGRGRLMELLACYPIDGWDNMDMLPHFMTIQSVGSRETQDSGALDLWWDVEGRGSEEWTDYH